MQSETNDFFTIKTPSGLTIYHRGPSLDKGPLPTFIYFALSGRDSLLLAPYNQPVTFLESSDIRTISFNLPAHEEEDNPHHAMTVWTEKLKTEPAYLTHFLELCLENIDFLIEQQIADPKHLATAGLSRGGLIAAHIAAKHPNIDTIAGFAPLTTIEKLVEYNELECAIINEMNLESLIPKLIHKKLRFYIGNRDTRVGTEACYSFIQKLTEEAHRSGVRSPQTELILYPSIGHKGHGTPPNIFQSGSKWIKSILLKN